MLLKLDVISDPLVAQRLTNVGKAFGSGAAAAYLTDKAINLLNDAQIGSALYDFLHPAVPDHANFIADLQSKFQQAEVTRSPLILDLDGDGVETIGKSAGIHFDHDSNRFAETTGWVGKDDGLLVWDRNGNGKIDNGGELFGNKTKLADGTNAANGFAALTELDSNHDGVIDASDAEFSRLRVWKDADSDAIMSDGELLGLEATGVQSIKVAYGQQNTSDAQGNQHLQIGQYTRIDGSTRAMDDVWFAADMACTTDMNTVAIADDIAALPDLQGFGNVPSLHQAMARDTTGKLQALLTQFINEPDATVRSALTKDLIFTWAGVDGVDPASRAATLIYGNVIGDARKLATLEAFLGEGYLGTWCGGARDSNPHGQAAPILLQAFEQLEARFSFQLMAQTHFKDLYDSVELTWDTDTLAISLDVSRTVDKLSALYDTAPEKASSDIKAFGESLKASGAFGAQAIKALRTHGNWSGTGLPLLLAAVGAEVILGDRGNNEIAANADHDAILMGMDGNDRLNGNSGNDILNGGAANDSLNGGAGNDTYLFARGNGVDTIFGYNPAGGSSDVAQFTDVASTEVTWIERRGADLVLKYAEADQLTVTGYFDANAPGDQIKRFNFSDGVSWNDAAIKARAITNGSMSNDYIIGDAEGPNRMYGLDGDDHLEGGAMADLIDGGDGNDTLYGNDGDDLLDGGAGDDLLYGGDGADTIRFGRGYGSDVFRSVNSAAYQLDTIDLFDIRSTEVDFLRLNNDLDIRVHGSSDQLAVSDYFSAGDSATTVRQLRFSDGITMDSAAVKVLVVSAGDGSDNIISGFDGGPNRIYGMGGNDTLNGGSGNDFIDGGDGNDTLYGNDGDDLLDAGAGNDLIYGGNGADTIRFGMGYGSDFFRSVNSAGYQLDTVDLFDIRSPDVDYVRLNNDLEIRVHGSSDKLTLGDYFSASDSATTVRQLQFADGIRMEKAAVRGLAMSLGDSSDNVISGFNDGPNRIYGLGGNDTLNGGSGNDIINGGNGNDTLYGDDGDDLLDAGAGDDLLYGGDGADTIRFGIGYGSDVFRSVNSAAYQLDTVDLFDIRATDVDFVRLNKDLEIRVHGSSDKLALGDYFSASDSATTVRQLQFADGVTLDNLAVKSLAVLAGDSSDNMISGFNDGPNRIYGLGGNDILTGGSGNDFIDGGDGNDTLYGGTGNELLIGGAGDDFIATGTGYDIIAFNRDDGRDTVAASAGRDNTLSLGGGISDVDLLFSRSANDLVLATGGNEQITFSDWYAGNGNHSMANLQILAEGGAGNHAAVLAQFDFNGLASRFDEAQAADPAITRWALASSMMAFHLGSSDAAALGGELAYQYASHGAMGGWAASFGQSQLGSAQFGVSSQATGASSALQDAASRPI